MLLLWELTYCVDSSLHLFLYSFGNVNSRKQRARDKGSYATLLVERLRKILFEKVVFRMGGSPFPSAAPRPGMFHLVV